MTAARACGLAIAVATLTAWPAVGTGLAQGQAEPAGGPACDRFAGPDGSDADSGRQSSPVRTMQALADLLAPGEVGCLRAGTYHESDVEITEGGEEGAPVTLRSHPGERATLLGRLWIAEGADFVTILGLDLDGSGAPECPEGGTCELQPSPVVNGDYAKFIQNDVTNDNSAICFTLGSAEYGRAVGTVIADNSIHHCGRLPTTNHDHGIYVSRADDTEIVGNLIYANADRGVQLYPDAQRTRVAGNVIDGNGTGVQFSGGEGAVSNDNLVEHNLITDSEIADVTSWYPDEQVGSGNVVRRNCIGTIEPPEQVSGYSLEDNREGDPLYVDAAAADFRLREGSPCLELPGELAGSQPTSPSGEIPGPGVPVADPALVALLEGLLAPVLGSAPP